MAKKAIITNKDLTVTVSGAFTRASIKRSTLKSQLKKLVTHHRTANPSPVAHNAMGG